MQSQVMRQPQTARGARLVRTLVVALIGCLGVTASRLWAEEESARDLFRRVIANIPKVSFAATMTLTNTGSVRQFELRQKQLTDTLYASYLEVIDPFDLKGTRFLFLEHTNGPDEQYVYIPNIRRVTRVGAQVRDQQFLGSEFLVSDFVLPDPDSLDFTEAGTDTVNGRVCRLVDVVPKPSAKWSYTKARYAIDAVDLLVLRTEFTDEKGPLKVWTVVETEKIDGIWTPRKQRMKNVREQFQSELEIDSVRYGVDLADDLFTRSYLERQR